VNLNSLKFSPPSPRTVPKLSCRCPGFSFSALQGPRLVRLQSRSTNDDEGQVGFLGPKMKLLERHFFFVSSTSSTSHRTTTMTTTSNHTTAATTQVSGGCDRVAATLIGLVSFDILSAKIHPRLRVSPRARLPRSSPSPSPR
jgi:hypothetical protein